MPRITVAVHNERVKLFAGFLNAISLGLIGFAVLRPITDDISQVSWITLWWGLAGLVIHGFAHYIMGMMRKESRP
ncbi:hypothetical protein BV911_08675 [Pseudoruegeria sp. SK021]|nr:hypothetical protein BV911_08675 [Pseudoruegeria sp. SK021]